jgi:hypothetical protein
MRRSEFPFKLVPVALSEIGLEISKLHAIQQVIYGRTGITIVVEYYLRPRAFKAAY